MSPYDKFPGYGESNVNHAPQSVTTPTDKLRNGLRVLLISAAFFAGVVIYLAVRS